jgi:hypothetical protein
LDTETLALMASLFPNFFGDSGWIAVSGGIGFKNGWSAGSTAPAYRKIGNHVYLRGEVTGGTAGTAAFTLPAGYAPTIIGYWSCPTAASTMMEVEVDTAGDVLPGVSATVDLQSISFLTN